MRVQSSALLINGATTPITNEAYVNNSCDILGLQVFGTFSTATVKVQGVCDPSSTDWRDIMVINLSDLSTGENISAKGLYEIAIESLAKVRISVTSVAGGGISVYGRFADTSSN